MCINVLLLRKKMQRQSEKYSSRLLKPEEKIKKKIAKKAPKKAKELFAKSGSLISVLKSKPPIVSLDLSVIAAGSILLSLPHHCFVAQRPPFFILYFK